MFSKPSFVTSMVLFLAGVPQISAHARFYDSVGDADQSIHGTGSIIYSSNQAFRTGYADQDPDQLDTTCFSDPIVPAISDSPYWGRPRKWMAQGCGASLSKAKYFFSTSDKYKQDFLYRWPEGSAAMTKHRNIYYWQMTPIPQEALTVVQAQTMFFADRGTIPKVTPGGWLQMMVYQVNDDGAGPFRCRFDGTGTANNFGEFFDQSLYLAQPPGTSYGKGSNPSSNYQKWPLKIKIPKDINCQATFGSVSNVCIIRCENSAENGPFGACVPFQVVYPPKAYTPPAVVIHPPAKETPKVQYGDPGYSVKGGKQEVHWKEKRADSWRGLGSKQYEEAEPAGKV
ncbi:hypothetical protein TWF694_005651 [Orbilia ellipsospora]|uniref:Uncharacterized protein n=1 Tax=Orbilia ellipsospora TaxID=2528407 RepID=A0AAV9WRI5_9PEZI